MDESFQQRSDGTSTLSPGWGTFKHLLLLRVETRFLDRRSIIRYYAVVLGLAAAGLIAFLVYATPGVGSPYAVAALCAMALYAEAHLIRIGPAAALSVTAVLFILAAVLFGPLAAILVASAGLLVEFRRRDGDEPTLRWLVWTSSTVLISGATGLAVLVTGGTQPHTAGKLAFSVLAAASADIAADLALSPLPGVLRGKVKWAELLRAVIPMQLLAFPFYVPLIGVLAYAYVQVSPWAVAFFVVPALAAHRLFLLYQHQREASGQLHEANERLAGANLSFATALVATLDARDQYTAGHSAAVAVYARDIAARMGLSSEEMSKAHLCGFVHDIGKVGLPSGLLEKTGPLSLSERRQMEAHSTIGERILAKVEDYADIARIVRHHHERVDGTGYPDGLVGEDIPLVSRIIAVADAYNAMTSDRPYRDAMPTQVARMRLAQAVGSQFDTAVVAAFEAILATSSDSYRRGIREDFSLGAHESQTAPLSDVA